MYLNKMVFSGRLVKIPEIYQTTNNKVVQFNLKQERNYFSQGKEREEDIWLLCEAWRSYAEDIARNYQEGDTIKIEGYLRPYKGKNVLMVEKYEKL